jgi:hypothetical protein
VVWLSGHGNAGRGVTRQARQVESWHGAAESQESVMRDDYMTLDGYRVDALTDKALGLRRGTMTEHRPLKWVPRSVVEHGDRIEKGETDICVQQWFIDKEGLIT